MFLADSRTKTNIKEIALCLLSQTQISHTERQRGGKHTNWTPVDFLRKARRSVLEAEWQGTSMHNPRLHPYNKKIKTLKHNYLKTRELTLINFQISLMFVSIWKNMSMKVTIWLPVNRLSILVNIKILVPHINSFLTLLHVSILIYLNFVCLLFLFFFSETWFLCGALAVLELTRWTRLTLKSEIHQPLPPECWD